MPVNNSAEEAPKQDDKLRSSRIDQSLAQNQLTVLLGRAALAKALGGETMTAESTSVEENKFILRLLNQL